MTSEELYKLLQSSPDGLQSELARARFRSIGPNEISHEQHGWQKQLFHALINPFNLLLAALAATSYATSDLRAAMVMGAMVSVSVVLAFVQEFRSSRAAEKLKAMVSTHATVIRRTGYLDGGPKGPVAVKQKSDIPINQLVPGDIIFLSAGDMIPGDCRLITSKDLFIAQSALTGESLPVEKFALVEPEEATGLVDLRNICFMGTNVVSGTGTAIILKTGNNTYIGSIAKTVAGQRIQTNFDKGIQQFTWLMLRFMAVMVPLVFVINGFTKGDWFEALMFAVAIAVGLTPEMLPMIVTVNLAKGALSMAKKKVIVKRLNAIQNFGAMDVLCTDKTGTLTQDKVVLEKYVDPFGGESEKILEYAFLNSFYQTGLKNLLDVAILKHVEVAGRIGVQKHFKKHDEIPFDFQRRRMSVIVSYSKNKHILICKGALEEMLSICTEIEVGGKSFPPEGEIQAKCHEVAQDLNDDGLRVIAVAYKELPATEKAFSVADESNLTLIGYVAFLDPPKETAPKAIEALHQHGVKVKVLTGDNDRVTRKICKEVGLSVDDLVLGSQIESMSDEELEQIAESSSVFAKLSPTQKERIVHALVRKKHVVGFMGDGINDSPALKAADVGISVDNAVDVAKESADIILLEKSLMVLEEGVIEGRKVFGNIVKYVKMGASSNFGNVFSVLGASLILPFLPMLPLQLLSQNLLYDLSQTAIPLDDVDEEYLNQPRKWMIGDIARFMLFMGPVSSLFDYLTFWLMWHVFGANSPEHQSLFQSGWFVEGLLSQTLIVHMIRTKKIPFLQSRASAPLLFMTAIVMAIGIYIPFSMYGSHIGLVPLPKQYFYYLAGMLFSYCILTQLVKTWFIKRFGYH
jgi:Mg2+-importing ATPase